MSTMTRSVTLPTRTARTGDEIAEYAEALAAVGLDYINGKIDERAPGVAQWQQVSFLICWHAAVTCMHQAARFPKAIIDPLMQIQEVSFSNLVSRTDPVVEGPDAIKAVPRGAVIAFIRVVPPSAESDGQPVEYGTRELTHVMISLGDGFATGGNNGCLGFSGDSGEHPSAAWERFDLGSKLRWRESPHMKADGSGREMCAYFGDESQPTSVSGLRRVRYRVFEDFLKAPRPFVANKSVGNLDIVTKRKRWWW